MTRAGSCGIIALSTLLGGCGPDMQSVLAPQGEQAERIATLAWLLFGLGTAVLALVIAAVWLALAGPQRARRWLARENTVVVLGIVFPTLTLTLLLGYGVWVMRSGHELTRDAGGALIEVVGEQWWWRVTYVGSDGKSIASANEIRIPVGIPVDFKLKTTDVIHSFWVPSLGGKVDMIPGRTTTLRLTARLPGVYRGQCAEYCGGPHALMALQVIAMPPDEHAAWLKRAAPPPSSRSGDHNHGQSLFLATGCGACHTVRGTAATGTIGPDLTHLGSRRSVGIDTLPMNHANLVRFVTDGQHVKPGNLMPEFRVLKPADADALAAYLLTLKVSDQDG